jgi:hypothetical protein
MADPRRLESVPPSEVADRDSRAEALLVDGLDRYFSGQYEEAIHLWTRVLFLDRSHARARAYIDRARTAMAERQRSAEAMLATTSDLLTRGNTHEARRLLAEAVAAAGDDERAAELRVRLERVERAQAAWTGGPTRPAAVAEAVPVRMPRRLVRGLAWTAASVLCVSGVVVLVAPFFRDWLNSRETVRAIAPVAEAPLPVPSRDEIALVRARTLYARGRLAEALQALDRVSVTGSARSAADALRIEIQQVLLAAGPTRPLGADIEGAGR